MFFNVFSCCKSNVNWTHRRQISSSCSHRFWAGAPATPTRTPPPARLPTFSTHFVSLQRDVHLLLLLLLYLVTSGPFRSEEGACVQKLVNRLQRKRKQQRRQQKRFFPFFCLFNLVQNGPFFSLSFFVKYRYPSTQVSGNVTSITWHQQLVTTLAQYYCTQ